MVNLLEAILKRPKMRTLVKKTTALMLSDLSNPILKNTGANTSTIKEDDLDTYEEEDYLD